MEKKSHHGIKEAVFICLVFLGIFIGAVFVFATIIGLLKMTASSVIEKGIFFSFLLSFILTTIIRIKRSHGKFNFRYWSAVVVFFAGTVFTVLMGGGKILSLVDIPSLLIVGIVPFLFVSILFGFKEMACAFSIQSKSDCDKETLEKAIRFFDIYGKTLWLTGIISVIIGIINILINLGDTAAFGPNLALALISIFYCCIIHILIIIPSMMAIKNQLGTDT